MKESAALLPLSEGYQQLQQLQKEVRGSRMGCSAVRVHAIHWVWRCLPQ
jgi:hypothetical protein